MMRKSEENMQSVVKQQIKTLLKYSSDQIDIKKSIQLKHRSESDMNTSIHVSITQGHLQFRSSVNSTGAINALNKPKEYAKYKK